MAYMNQTKKSEIAALLKAVVPAGWKYSLAVRDLSVLVMTIRSAPVDLIAATYPGRNDVTVTRVTCEIMKDRDLAATFEKILSALNTGNYDRSDSQSDYFDVGHYVYLKVGHWDKGFKVSDER